MHPFQIHSARKAISAGLLALLAVTVAGCAAKGPSPDVTGSVAARAEPRTDADWRREMDAWGARYRANQGDAEAAVRYAQALRAIGQRSQAAAVLEQAAIRHPHDMTVLGAYGRALADNGSYQQALDILSRAHTPDRPDWRILSVQGAVLDQMGRHPEAQRHYASALRLMPDEPSVLSNLGLSYALSNNLSEAETTLRRATARGATDPKVPQNLALVVGLQGRFQEAETIARGDLSPEEASANVAYLRQMLAQRSAPKPAGRSGQRVSSSTGS